MYRRSPCINKDLCSLLRRIFCVEFTFSTTQGRLTSLPSATVTFGIGSANIGGSESAVYQRSLKMNIRQLVFKKKK
ncbi:hypothetical protein V1477_014662 [Vespula maculifrons]|uniref:Uncharacterized protein n=1 Tax=Vespula maculifrons TaxID=7453 RepID=A0ABD2BI31_VESMC